MSSLTLNWLKSELAEILQFPDTEEIAKYVLSIENSDDREEYLREMLDPNRSKNFFQELKLRDPPKMVPYKKPDLQDTVGGARPKSSGTFQAKQSREKENSPPPHEDSVGSKKKSKYVALYSSEGQAKEVVKLKGRHVCECQASKHELINNCLECGKIVCSQEGSGPCLFCGALVCSKDENEVLNRNSKKSEQLRKKLLAVGGGDPRNLQISSGQDGLVKAEEHKRTLLEYDRTSEQRTKVIDDESDYFSLENNQWLTPQQRKVLQKRSDEITQMRHGSRLDKKYTFDFAGRQVKEDQDSWRNYNPNEDSVVNEIYHKKKNDPFGNLNSKKAPSLSSNDLGIANLDINVPRPMLVDSMIERISSGPNAGDKSKNSSQRGLRLQDPQLQEMSDEGFCLSMHQPWASYLVAGIKLDEGRTWYSAHRGRLWIHAAGKEPTKEEIVQVQRQICHSRGIDRMNFPPLLPTSCLLGCVDVADCLGQEEYRELYPNGESDSPFVFICTNPQELMVKFPMTGKHKIYKLDPKIHQAAKKTAKKTSAV